MGEARRKPKQQITPQKQKRKASPVFFTKIKMLGEETRRLFLSQKTEQENVQTEAPFSAEIYTAEDWQEEERYAREERAAIKDEDGFEKVSR